MTTGWDFPRNWNITCCEEHLPRPPRWIQIWECFTYRFDFVDFDTIAILCMCGLCCSIGTHTHTYTKIKWQQNYCYYYQKHHNAFEQNRERLTRERLKKSSIRNKIINSAKRVLFFLIWNHIYTTQSPRIDQGP